MHFATAALPEFDHEMASTRRVLERLPEDKLDWRIHAKSNTIGWNANHLAEIPGWVVGVFTQSSLNVNPPSGPRYATPNLASRQAILDLFDRNVAAGRQALASAKDETLGDMWSLLDGDKVIFAMPRAAVYRGFIMNHLIHHRGILTVYYRVNDIPVPAMYGVSADEP